MMLFLQRYNNYTDKQKIIVHYGLESLYSLTSKLIIIAIISILLGIFKEMFAFLFFYSLLRLFAYGVHLSNSKICLVVSSSIFLFFTYVCIYTSIEISYRIIIAGISICSVALYSPADTVKRPLIRENDRIKKKIISFILCCAYLATILFVNNEFLRNLLTYSMLLEGYLITPFAYKLFKQPYNNYVAYGIKKRKEEYYEYRC
jgi:accessory gene regulator B